MRPTTPPPPKGFTPEDIADQVAAFKANGGQVQIVGTIEREDKPKRHIQLGAGKRGKRKGPKTLSEREFGMEDA